MKKNAVGFIIVGVVVILGIVGSFIYYMRKTSVNKGVEEYMETVDDESSLEYQEDVTESEVEELSVEELEQSEVEATVEPEELGLDRYFDYKSDGAVESPKYSDNVYLDYLIDELKEENSYTGVFVDEPVFDNRTKATLYTVIFDDAVLYNMAVDRDNIAYANKGDLQQIRIEEEIAEEHAQDEDEYKERIAQLEAIYSVSSIIYSDMFNTDTSLFSDDLSYWCGETSEGYLLNSIITQLAMRDGVDISEVSAVTGVTWNGIYDEMTVSVGGKEYKVGTYKDAYCEYGFVVE